MRPPGRDASEDAVTGPKGTTEAIRPFASLTIDLALVTLCKELDTLTPTCAEVLVEPLATPPRDATSTAVTLIAVEAVVQTTSSRMYRRLSPDETSAVALLRVALSVRPSPTDYQEWGRRLTDSRRCSKGRLGTHFICRKTRRSLIEGRSGRESGTTGGLPLAAENDETSASAISAVSLFFLFYARLI